MPHPITIRRLFADRLRQLRASYSRRVGQRLNQTQFAALLGIKIDRYSAYERGDREPPLDVLARLKQVTGVSLDEMIAGQPTGPASVNPAGAYHNSDTTFSVQSNA